MPNENTARLWDGAPLLPPIGALVLIAHGRDDFDHVCEVTGYDVQESLSGERNLHRVFVKLKYRGTETENMRLLNDIRPLTKARSIAQGAA
ncbi:hypothetical protein WS67_12055 [Burkholderia singularis]|uniref:Uncharacterized protein n=1 Tax=Burkholderia singularis TaxID=1503053 RepID=A0A103E2N2_9BURK|nr:MULTISPECIES: hypothetical protein [Burkholderia]KVE27230.1 hypothetical protein WS67_12055 [Burkholderia singularis]KVE33724.1 hypothetical protein WS68_11150 [Burkholderia sp. TSV86]